MGGKYNEQDGSITCSVCSLCGGCCYTDMAYNKELEKKYKRVSGLFKDYVKCQPIVGMYRPAFYRNKVHGIVGRGRDKKIVTGIYQEGTHRLVPVDKCMIEDKKSDEIMMTLCGLFDSFKYEPYNEDTKGGFMRHVLIRRGFSTGEILVVLVTSEVAFPSKNNFIKVLRSKHPEITTIVQNINNASTSMILGKRSITRPPSLLSYLASHFRISSSFKKSFTFGAFWLLPSLKLFASQTSTLPFIVMFTSS